MISPQSLARASSRHPWLTLGCWLVAVVVAVVLSGALLADALTTDMSYTNNPEAKRAERLIEERLRGPDQNMELVIVRSRSRTVDDAAFRAHVEALQRDVAALGPAAVQATLSYYQTGDTLQVSEDRHTTLVAVMLPSDDEDAHEVIPDLRTAVDHDEREAKRGA